MRYLCLVFLVFVHCSLIYAQSCDAQWILSYNTSTLNFGLDTVSLDTIPGNMPMISTDANICDSGGNLLYFTNGIYIADRNGNMLLNGDSLNPCPFTSQEFSNGLDIGQAAIFLPKPGSFRYYYLIHFSNDTDSNSRPGTLYYTVIDKEGNYGLGAAIEKNVPFFKGTILREGGMTACKHANGRDYWIVMAGHYTNTFYTFLLKPDTIVGPLIQNIGPVYNDPYDWGCSKFSQDGSKFVTSCAAGLVLVMDFDRCSGEFSNATTIVNNAPPPFQPISGASSVEFSPNGRYVYVCNVVNLNQYDLFADTIQDSIQLYLSDSSDFYQMDKFQVAPNGKIYGCPYNGGLYALHVINSPDAKGDSCHFVYGGQSTLSLNSNELPNMINYNLGPLISSGCDTIPNGLNQVAENNLLRIMPNPADKYLYVEMGMQGNYEFDLINEAGQVIARKETRQVDNFDTENLANGTYFLRILDKNNLNEIVTQKVIVQH